MNEGGVPLYFYPSNIEVEKLNVISSLVSITITLRKHALGETGSKIKLTTDYGELYIYREGEIYIALIGTGKIDDMRAWNSLSTICEKVIPLISNADDVLIDVGLSDKITNLIKDAINWGREAEISEMESFSEALLDTVLREEKTIPNELKGHVKEVLVPVITDRTLLKKEKDPIKRKVLTLCDGKHDIEAISKKVGMSISTLMIILTRYKGKIVYRPKYKLVW